METINRIQTDFDSVYSLVLAYPENFEDKDYRNLISFYDQLIEKIPEEIDLYLVVKNKSIGEKVRFKRKKGKVIPIIISDFNEIWLRDIIGFLRGNSIIKPIFKPEYEKDKYTTEYLKKLDDQVREIIKALDKNTGELNLIWDGGNLVTNGKIGIITDKIIRDNKDLDVHRIILEKLGIIPVIVPSPNPKYDKLAHTDGYMAFLSEKTMVLSHYPDDIPSLKEDNQYLDILNNILNANGIDTIPLQDRPVLRSKKQLSNNPDDYMYGAEGIYVNYLRLNHTVLVPRYTLSTPKETKNYNNGAIKFFESHGLKPIPIECDQLAALGGVLHCISFTF